MERVNKMTIASGVSQVQNGFWRSLFHMNHHITSPVTGIIDEANVVIDYGEHQGRTVKEVQELDPDFYEALIEQKGVGAYALKREAHLDGNKTFRLYLNPLAQMDQ